MAQDQQANNGAQARFQPTQFTALSLRAASQVVDMQLATTRVLMQTQARTAAAFGLPDWSAWFETADERARRLFSTGAEQLLSTTQRANEAAQELQREMSRLWQTQTVQAADQWQRGVEQLGAQAQEGLNQLVETAKRTAEQTQRTSENLGRELQEAMFRSSEQLRDQARQAGHELRASVVQTAEAAREAANQAGEAQRQGAGQAGQSELRAAADEGNKGDKRPR